MKKGLIKLIELYQRMPVSSHKLCRFYPTCSEYMKGCLENFGVFKGLFLGFKRILKCHPFGSFGIDLVPNKEK